MNFLLKQLYERTLRIKEKSASEITKKTNSLFIWFSSILKVFWDAFLCAALRTAEFAETEMKTQRETKKQSEHNHEIQRSMLKPPSENTTPLRFYPTSSPRLMMVRIFFMYISVYGRSSRVLQWKWIYNSGVAWGWRNIQWKRFENHTEQRNEIESRLQSQKLFVDLIIVTFIIS